MQSDRDWRPDFMDGDIMSEVRHALAEAFVVGADPVKYQTVKDLVNGEVLPFAADIGGGFKDLADLMGTPSSTRMFQARTIALMDMKGLPEALRTSGVEELISTIYAIALGVPNLTYPNLENL